MQFTWAAMLPDPGPKSVPRFTPPLPAPSVQPARHLSGSAVPHSCVSPAETLTEDTHAHTRKHTHVQTHAETHTCTHTHTHSHMSAHMRTYTHTRKHTHTHKRAHTCTGSAFLSHFAHLFCEGLQCPSPLWITKVRASQWSREPSRFLPAPIPMSQLPAPRP